MIYIKSEKEIEYMKEAANVLKKALLVIEENIKEGITTEYLDSLAEDVMLKSNAEPSFKGVECPYSGGEAYKHSICVSINDEIIHGIPSSRVLKKGDVVSIDLGVYKNGYHSDAGRTFVVGEVSNKIKKLIYTAEEAFFAGAQNAKPGKKIGDISNAIQKVVEKAGFSLVREYQGHGIGKDLHEDPGVPNMGRAGRGVKLEKGMAIAIEPMIVMGYPEIEVSEDLWTVKTKDGSMSSYYENTIIITDDEPDILTL